MSIFDVDCFLAGLMASQVFIHGARMERATMFYDDYASNDAKIETITAFLIFFISGLVGCTIRRFTPEWVYRSILWLSLVVWVISTAGVGYSFNPNDIPIPHSLAERVTILTCKHTSAGIFFFVTLSDALRVQLQIPQRFALVSIVLSLEIIFWNGTLTFGTGGHIYVDRMGFVCSFIGCVMRFLLVHPVSPAPAPPKTQKNSLYFACSLLHAVIVWLFTSFAFITILPFQNTDYTTHFWGFFIGILIVSAIPGPSIQDITCIIFIFALIGLNATGVFGFLWGLSTGVVWAWITIQPARKVSIVNPEEWMAILCLSASLGSVTQFGMLHGGGGGDFAITVICITILVCVVALCGLYSVLGWTGIYWSTL